jgi:hypothetical protein
MACTTVARSPLDGEMVTGTPPWVTVMMGGVLAMSESWANSAVATECAAAVVTTSKDSWPTEAVAVAVAETPTELDFMVGVVQVAALANDSAAVCRAAKRVFTDW